MTKNNFWPRFREFVIDRSEVGYKRFAQNDEYQLHQERFEELGRKMYDPQNKEQWLIWDQLMTERSAGESIVMEASYLQGLCDGVALAGLLSGELDFRSKVATRRGAKAR